MPKQLTQCVQNVSCVRYGAYIYKCACKQDFLLHADDKNPTILAYLVLIKL